MRPEFENTKIAFQYRSTQELQLSRMIFNAVHSTLLTRAGILLTRIAFALHIPVQAVFRHTLFRQFCGGTTLLEAGKVADKLHGYNVSVILDYGAEGKQTVAALNHTVFQITSAIRYASANDIPFISVKVTGIGRFALLEQVHRKETLKPDAEREWQQIMRRMDLICSLAAELGVMVLVDAEETWIQDAVNLVIDEMMLRYNRQKAVVFNTFQLYCKDTLGFLKESHQAAKKAGYLLGAKLVRGAYMEKERARAQELHYTDPIQPNKEDTDRDFDDAVNYCLEHIEDLSLFIGTHNEESCALATVTMKRRHIPADHPHVYFSQLYGMSDHISFNLANQGYRVAKYLPYGPVRDVIPYLLRRAEENTAISGQSGKELMLINRELFRRNQQVSTS